MESRFQNQVWNFWTNSHVTNSPATFQRLMDGIFAEEIAQEWLTVYMDDILIASETKEDLCQKTPCLTKIEG